MSNVSAYSPGDIAVNMAAAGTRVVNIRHAPKQFQMGQSHVYIGRARGNLNGYFGNPYSVEPHGRDVAISLFRSYFEKRVASDPAYRAAVLGLKGKVLVCYCAPQACHGNVIAEWVDSQ